MEISIDAKAEGRPLAHAWSVCVGGGRVGEAMRADFQKHLEMAQRDMPFKYLRMHGLFHEDMMVYRLEGGKRILNWQYVDLVFDHWLSVGIRPFVELSFMPYDLASGDQTVFWWKGNVTPPKDPAEWERLVEDFARHVVERYGREETRRWYYEVWNEPALKYFWKDADFPAYMDLYERSVRALKRVDPLFRVGGPSSHGFCDAVGEPPWGREFLAACAERGLPVDFFSAHPYPTLHPVDPEGRGYMVWDGPDRLLRDLSGCESIINASAYPNAERHYTEWSSSPSPRDPVHDTAFMAPFIVRSNWLARGWFDSLSYWTVSDVFEECRQGDVPFHGGFGLVNLQGLKKPAYHGYWFLSRLGEEELGGGDSYAVTRRRDGSLAILLWNYCHYRADANDSRMLAEAGPGKIYGLFEDRPTAEFRLRLGGFDRPIRVQATRFDRNRGSSYDAWAAMGAPAHARPADLEVLRRRMEPEASVSRYGAGAGERTLSESVEPFGVTLLEIREE